MLISLHKQATTTPKVRAAIQASDEPARVAAERYGISEQTVWKWRNRDGTEDRSHTPHRLQTTPTPAQAAVAVSLRRTLLVPLDDLLAVVRAFLNPSVSRSGLDRCLRRHGVPRLQELKPKAPKPAHKPFKAHEPGYLGVDVKCLPPIADEDRRRYLFVAIDRAIPDMLLSGDHGRIAEWRREQAEALTRARRPDLLGTDNDDNG
jgi:transposase-like protein